MISHATANPSTSLIDIELSKLIETDRLDVPMLPEVARKVVQVAEDPESDSATMSKLIQGDQTLAAQVMRIANSAMYNPGGASMVSLQQAITRLGMKRMAEIALAASLHAELFNVPGYEDHVVNILKRALAAGLWAKEIARSARKNVEAAFLGGLMHDIGRPVALQCIVQVARKHEIELSEDDIFSLEERYQRQIGTKVVEQWQLPEMVREVVAFFDNPEAAENNQFQVLTVIAGALFADIQFNGEGKAVEIDEENSEKILTNNTMAELNFYRTDIEELLEKADQVRESVEAMSL